MKKIFIVLIAALVAVACNTNQKPKETTEESGCCTDKKEKTEACCSQSADSTILSVDELISTPDQHIDKTVNLKGRVIHTCSKSGKKMFIAGTDENALVRIDAGDEISIFEKSLEGEMVIATGSLTASAQEEAHDNSDKGSCTTETKSKNFQMTCSSYSIVQE